MTFEQLYSGSSGNLYVVTTDNGKRLVIECGVTWLKLQKALNYDLSNIIGCLCSHEHADHSKAIGHLMRAGIDVFASAGTFEALGIKEAMSYHRRVKVIHDKTIIRFIGASLKVRAFATNHDAAEPLGFVVKDGSEYLLFATDTSYITQQFKVPFSIVAIECSYDKNILQKRVDTGDTHETVAKRLLTSHLEKQEAMRYLDEFCDLSKCREIHLLHMSGDNIDKAQAKKDFEKRFFIETRMVESANAPSSIYD